MLKNYFSKAVKFLIAGGLGMLVSLVVLFLFTDVLNIWYLISSIISFIFGVVVNFTLQKYWVFQDSAGGHIPTQAAMFGTLGVLNLIGNTFLLYFFTDILHFWYIYSQVFTTFILALFNFLLYQTFIFRKKNDTP